MSVGSVGGTPPGSGDFYSSGNARAELRHEMNVLINDVESLAIIEGDNPRHGPGNVISHFIDRIGSLLKDAAQLLGKDSQAYKFLESAKKTLETAMHYTGFGQSEELATLLYAAGRSIIDAKQSISTKT